MKPLEGLLILSRQNKSHGNIYKKDKGRRQIYDELGSQECQLMRGRLTVLRLKFLKTTYFKVERLIEFFFFFIYSIGRKSADSIL